MKSKELKRQEAEVRQTIYNELSNVEKTKKLDEGNYRALRQRKRLQIQLEQRTV